MDAASGADRKPGITPGKVVYADSQSFSHAWPTVGHRRDLLGLSAALAWVSNPSDYKPSAFRLQM